MQPNVQNMMQNSLSQLKDIKPIIDVPDNSLLILSAIVSTLVILIIFLLFKYVTKIRKTKKPTPKQMAFKKLQHLDYKNTKDVVYSFSVDGYLFVNEKNKTQFDIIEKELERYKYKKDVESLSNDLIEKIKDFIKGIKR